MSVTLPTTRGCGAVQWNPSACRVSKSTSAAKVAANDEVRMNTDAGRPTAMASAAGGLPSIKYAYCERALGAADAFRCQAARSTVGSTTGVDALRCRDGEADAAGDLRSRAGEVAGRDDRGGIVHVTTRDCLSRPSAREPIALFAPGPRASSRSPPARELVMCNEVG